MHRISALKRNNILAYVGSEISTSTLNPLLLTPPTPKNIIMKKKTVRKILFNVHVLEICNANTLLFKI